MVFEVFRGDFSQFATFKANQERIYEMFYDASAPVKGAIQQLFQWQGGRGLAQGGRAATRAATQLGSAPPYAHVMEDGSDSEDQEEFEKIHLGFKKEEIRKLLSSGTVSKKLYDILKIFTAKPVAPEHIWKVGCKNCSTCSICMETGGQTYVEKCQTDGFRAHL